MDGRRTRGALVPAIVLVMLSAACGGRTVSRSSAKALIAELDAGSLGKDAVTVESVTQSGGSLVVETRVKSAFRLERSAGRWEVKEIRVGNREWEDVGVLIDAIDSAKTARTRAMLETVMDAVGKYHAKNGAIPVFRDYVSLTDALYPEFLNPLLRLDAWHQPLAVRLEGSDSIRLLSGGADGRSGTRDDIEVLRRFR